jgi:hypothetical protein
VIPRSIDLQVRPEGMLVELPPLSVTTIEAELAKTGKSV